MVKITEVLLESEDRLIEAQNQSNRDIKGHLSIEGQANKAEIIEGLLGAEDRIATQMSDMMAKLDALQMERVNAMYTSIENSNKKKSTDIASLDLDSLTVVKGRQGKLGRGAHGQVKLAFFQPNDGGNPQKVAVKMVPVDDAAARMALQVRSLFTIDHLRRRR